MTVSLDTSLAARCRITLGTTFVDESLRWGHSPLEAMQEAYRARLGRMGYLTRTFVPTPLGPPPAPPAPPIAAEPSGFDELPLIGEPIERIQRACANDFQVGLPDLLSHRVWAGGRRSGVDLITPRHVGMYLARKMTQMSWSKIGKAFNRIDHSTPIHGYQKTQRRIAADPAFAARVAGIRARIEEKS